MEYFPEMKDLGVNMCFFLTNIKTTFNLISISLVSVPDTLYHPIHIYQTLVDNMDFTDRKIF